MKIYTLALIFSLSVSALSQTQSEIDAYTKNYDKEKIKNFIKHKSAEEKERQIKLKNHSRKYNEPLKVYREDGTFMQAVGINEKTNEFIYRSIYNIDASKSTRTNYLNPNGGLNLNLEGVGMKIGTWDGAAVLENHQEFSDGLFGYRTTNGDNSAINGNNGNSDHATHVTGTMIARGINSDAKGMAPKALNVFYDWNNDVAEVTNEAMNGLLISNHSYGIPIYDSGIMQVPEYLPGKYDPTAQEWDEIMYLNPYYLHVVSAGNEGNFNYPNQMAINRDKLVGEKNSKNNLVVANADDAQISQNGELNNVLINSSSSQGPTDDKRIKPDIAGNGTTVLSSVATGGSDYATFSGTSMASPNVAGSLLLLQEYYNLLNDTYMRSSTLRGLACHTADDAGQSGPDPIFGWGLLNTKKAAETIAISANDTGFIQELELSTGTTKTIKVIANGLEDLRASITWLDKPGNVSNTQLNNPTPVLVNDLDLRITKGETEYLPYKLPNNALNPAIRGDNIVDNIEIVDVEDAVTGEEYTITITTKSFFLTPQKYSLIITGASNTLNINKFDGDLINVWPNPVKNQLNITGTEAFEGQAEVKVYDLSGRLVLSSTKDSTSQNTIQINTSSLSTGTYLVKITDGKTSLNKKIIKE
ncbi:MAG: S8 family serine peptidase [Psychroflexus halocasei]